MEYMYAALLLHKAKHPINEANIKKVIEAAGVTADAGRVKAIVAALEGANIEEIIAKASTMMAAPAAQAAPAAEKKEEKKDEKKSEEEAAAGLGALFG